MVLVQFEIVFALFRLVWIGFDEVKRENVGFSNEMLSNFCQDPCFCFGYRLSYNHPNEVILIGKNHKR